MVRKLCDKCKQKKVLDEKTAAMIRETLKGVPESELEGIDLNGPLTVYEPRACSQCGDTGYKGRLGLFEVLPVEGNFQEAINKRLSVDELAKIAREEGMIDLKQDGMIKVLKGLTTLEEVLRVTKD